MVVAPPGSRYSSKLALGTFLPLFVAIGGMLSTQVIFSDRTLSNVHPESAQKNVINTDRGNGVADTGNLVEARKKIARRGRDLKITSVVSAIAGVVFAIGIAWFVVRNHAGEEYLNWRQPVRRTVGYGVLTTYLFGAAVTLSVVGGLTLDYASLLERAEECGSDPECELEDLAELDKIAREMHTGALAVACLGIPLFLYFVMDVLTPMEFQKTPHTVPGGFFA